MTARDIERIIELRMGCDSQSEEDQFLLEDLLEGEDFLEWLFNGEQCEVKSEVVYNALIEELEGGGKKRGKKEKG